MNSVYNENGAKGKVFLGVGPRQCLRRLVFGLLTLAVISGLAGCASWGANRAVCLGNVQLNDGGKCTVPNARGHKIPFRAGSPVRIAQGFHGANSHSKKELAYSVDFVCKEGTPVVASRAGVVWAVRTDSASGCGSMTCIDDANFVILDHGDGTFSEYQHLRDHGVLVEAGEQVCGGQVIGLCGSTGFSSGPHLHYAVIDAAQQTLPVQFDEIMDKNYGVVVPGASYVSGNERELACAPTNYSQIPRDAFVHQGIVLDRGLPAVLSRETRMFDVEGVYYGDSPNVGVYRKAERGGWFEECVPVGADGRFTMTLRWPSARYPVGYYWLMLSGSDADCSSQGWAWSYRVRVDYEPGTN